MKALISLRFFAGVPFYAFVPFFSVFLQQAKGLQKEDVAIGVFFLVFGARALSVLSYMVVRRFSPHVTLAVCYGLCSLSLFFLFIADNVYLLFVLGLVIGGLFSVGIVVIKIIGSSFSEIGQFKLFSNLSIAINVAFIVGSLFGDIISHQKIEYLPLFPLLTLGGIGILSFFLLKSSSQPFVPQASQEKGRRGGGAFLKGVFFLLLSFVPQFLYGYYVDGVAYRLQQVQSPVKASMLFLAGSVGIVLFQKFAYRRMQPFRAHFPQILLVTCVVLSLSFFLYEVRNVVFLISFALIFTIGEIVWIPLNDTLSASLFSGALRGKFIAFCNSSWGLSEALGAYVGVRFFGVPNSFLIGFLILISFVSYVGFVHFNKKAYL